MRSGRDLRLQILNKAKKKQGVCENCSEKRLQLLDFAHWCRSEKNDNMCNFVKNGSKEDVINELKLGRFLCLFCHRFETDAENVQIQKEKELEVYFKAKKNAQIKCKNCSEFVNFESIRKRRCTICEYKRQHFYYVNAKRCRDMLKKQRYKCVHCFMVVSYNNINLFEFDHISKDKKLGNIGDMRNTDEIIRESYKCQLLCSKCHRLKTLRQFNNVNVVA
ncbi:MAG: hypothetical protein CMB64_05315 [Euryarchaeota archaeon]|nr:hypothetical protein [Euryarchaeota archaeon]|tara:strand:- start:5439 stop:6098 length:660 start_codon:yes stop_codon:yes gene_type:complete